MAEFPRHQSKGQLTTQAPSAAAPEDNTYQITKNVGEFGKMVQEGALKWSNAVDTIQKTTATANFKSGILDITTRAQNDPDYNNSEQYFKEIEKLKTDNLQGFTNKGAENEMAIEFGYESNVAKAQLSNLYKKKMIDVGIASTMRLVDAEIANPTESSLQKIKSVLNAQVKSGLLNHEDAYKLERKANDDLGLNRINKDLFSAETPEQVDQVISGLTSGAYESGGVSIDPKQKEAMMNLADRRRKVVEEEYNSKLAIQYNKGEEDISNNIVSGAGVKETMAQADNAKQTGLISEEFYNLLAKSTVSSNSAESKAETYISLMTQYAKIRGQKDQARATRDFRNEVIVKKSLLSEKHYKELLSYAGAEKMQSSSSWMDGLLKFLKSVGQSVGIIGHKKSVETVEKLMSGEYKIGSKITKGGREYEVIKNDDGSVGFKEL